MNLRVLGKYLSERHCEFGIAWSLIGQGFSLLSFETFAILFCEKFSIYGPLALFIYVGIPVIGLIICIILGHLMLKTGYQDAYARYASDANSDWKRLCKDVKEIKEELKEIKKPSTE